MDRSITVPAAATAAAAAAAAAACSAASTCRGGAAGVHDGAAAVVCEHSALLELHVRRTSRRRRRHIRTASSVSCVTHVDQLHPHAAARIRQTVTITCVITDQHFRHLLASDTHWQPTDLWAVIFVCHCVLPFFHSARMIISLIVWFIAVRKHTRQPSNNKLPRRTASRTTVWLLQMACREHYTSSTHRPT